MTSVDRANFSRRSFLRLIGAAGLATTLDFPGQACGGTRNTRQGGGAIAYRRSGRGRHVSNAAKAHNANHLYATAQAALADPAHPGDKSYVVLVTISVSLYHALFGDGRQSVDLRHDLRTLSDYRNLSQCHAGPGQPAGKACAAQDQDGNGAVDLRDVSIFQRIFTGS